MCIVQVLYFIIGATFEAQDWWPFKKKNIYIKRSIGKQPKCLSVGALLLGETSQSNFWQFAKSMCKKEPDRLWRRQNTSCLRETSKIHQNSMLINFQKKTSKGVGLIWERQYRFCMVFCMTFGNESCHVFWHDGLYFIFRETPKC